MDNESKADEERRHRLEVESLVAQLRAIDDIMFRKLCENIAFVEEILRVILEDDKIPSLTVGEIKNCCKSTVYRLYGSLLLSFIL